MSVVTITNDKKPGDGWAVFYDSDRNPVLVWSACVRLVCGYGDGSVLFGEGIEKVFVAQDPFSVIATLDVAAKKIP